MIFMLLYEKRMQTMERLFFFFNVLDIDPFNNVQMASVKSSQVAFPFLFVLRKLCYILMCGSILIYRCYSRLRS